MKEDLNIDQVVRERYAEGAAEVQEALCCPVSYDPKFLKIIPQEILDKDYGCGDPSQYLQEGDTVLDLGSGGGKICYIASQIVGCSGKVIGVDFNPVMLELARKYKKEVSEQIGWDNVEFFRGKIQDLKTNLEEVDKKLQEKPLGTVEQFMDFDMDQKQSKPMIENESVDVIVSNCVLNLVGSEEKRELFKEMYRVLKRGGRVAISDIVADEIVPEHLRNDSELWSGCISGAYEEKAFIQAFEDAGFYGIKIEKRDENPWKVVEGIEFRSVTVTAYKGKEGPCLDRNQAVIYQGPWKQVLDDDGHILRRGVRTAVCEKTFKIYSKKPYAQDFYFLEPENEVPLKEAPEFDCSRNTERTADEMKGSTYHKTSKGSGSSCC